MHHTNERATEILAEAEGLLRLDDPPSLKLRRLWFTLAYIQSSDLARTLASMIGNKVFSGPFKGMQLPQSAMTGAFCPALLGTYEFELHPAFERFIAYPYQQILNIGCSYGYYSVGMALRMPNTIIHSFDIDTGEQQRCRDMVTLNNVTDRVIISGIFEGDKFASYAGKETLVIMDIEGAELDLLDPVKYPALLKMDVVVEMHDLMNATISKTIMDRFAPTHDIEYILNRIEMFDFTPIIGPGKYVDPFDQLLANWEARDGATPWAIMRRKVK